MRAKFVSTESQFRCRNYVTMNRYEQMSIAFSLLSSYDDNIRTYLLAVTRIIVTNLYQELTLKRYRFEKRAVHCQASLSDVVILRTIGVRVRQGIVGGRTTSAWDQFWKFVVIYTFILQCALTTRAITQTLSLANRRPYSRLAQSSIQDRSKWDHLSHEVYARRTSYHYGLNTLVVI